MVKSIKNRKGANTFSGTGTYSVGEDFFHLVRDQAGFEKCTERTVSMTTERPHSVDTL